MKSVFKKIIVTMLTWEARLVLVKYKPKMVAVTGSVGKTGSKDAIYTVLSKFFFVRKSEKSFNSEIGVPLAILGLPNAWSNPFHWLTNLLDGLWLIVFKSKYPQWLVLEVGADRPGDIERIAKWLKPDVAVITRLGKTPVHIEFFESVNELFEEKGSLVRCLKPEGALVLNYDDEDVRNFAEKFSGKIKYFGLESQADIFGSYYEIDYEKGEKRCPRGFSYKADANGLVKTVSVEGCVGRQYMYATLCALAVGLALDLDFDEMILALKKFEAPGGRMNLVPGVKRSLIIDDSYNSSPVALAEALATLESLKISGKKIAVLGDMLELGPHTVEAHKKAGEKAGSFCALLFTVGLRAQNIATGALEAGMSEKNILQYEDSRRVGKEIGRYIKAGDAILVKGSQGMRMERVVEAVMAHPEDKEKLLVRQDGEWKNR
jgi:UDP-N-acetylmuramoyl-tripeptide--D-alanyl-D-alanine ligase